MGHKSTKSAQQDPFFRGPPRDTAPAHQPLIDLGHVTLHRAYDPNDPKAQHGFMFLPKVEKIINLTDTTKAPSLLYVIPSQQDREQKRIMFLIPPKRRSSQSIESDTETRNRLQSLATIMSRNRQGPQRFSRADRIKTLEARHRTGSFEGLQGPLPEKGRVGLECKVCYSAPLQEPLQAPCSHVCCAECWYTWLEETADMGFNCPECEAPVDAEFLVPVTLCNVCFELPRNPWTSPCNHVGCLSCWQRHAERLATCPTCGGTVDPSLVPE